MEKRTFILFMILGGLLSFSGMKAEKYIPPHHPAIHYSGRVDRSNQDTVRFDWPGVSVQCRFSGKSIGIRINGGKDNHFNLFLDGELISIFRAPRDTTITIRPLQRKKTYELLLTKRTEADMGMARFMGIVLDDHGELYPLLKTPNRRIEFIGNSITCGYGTEGSCKEERFTPGTENNYQSYAAILARAFSAEAHFIAHSGKGVVRNYGDKKPVSDAGNTMPGCYNRTLDNNPARIWDFSSWKPDCVVINLGTNDFSTTPHPDKHTFLKGYRELLSRIRQNYGNIPVFCVAGPMINEPCFSYVKEFTLYCRNAEQDHQIFFAGLPDHLLNQAEDLGSDWHPSYKGQLKIAAQLLTPIATVMNWDYHNDEIHPCENDTKRHEQQKTSHPILAFETPGCTHIQSPDVLIVGGGTSGVSAGISSARAGVQTMILEESEWLGGMLTSAGVSAIDGNYNLPSGFWGEFKDSLTSYYGNAEALKTGWVSHVQFEPSAGNSILQQITAHEKNLTVHFKSKLKSIKKGNGQWTVLIETPGRTLTLHPKIIIDATELGDIALQCGVRYDVGMESRGKTREDVAPEKANDVIQDLTYVAILKDYGKDVTIPQPAGYNPHEFACSCENPLCENPNPLNTLWAKDKMITYGKLPNNKYMINWPIEGNDYYANLIDKNEMEREEVLRKAKNHTLCFLYFIQKELGMNTLGLADDEFPTEDKLPWIPYYRESLRIHGLVRFTLNHILSPYTQPDKLYRTCIAVGDYPVDHHHGKYPAWETLPHLHFPSIPSYGLPLGVMIPQDMNGLIVAEKSISVSNIVNGTTRLQPVVMQIGQAAGILAALAVKNNTNIENVSVREVQRILLSQGNYLLPFLDVEKGNPFFLPLQRIGVTGILQGTGKNEGWANQTWFRMNDPVLWSELSGLKDVYPTINIPDTDIPLSLNELLTLIHEIEKMEKRPVNKELTIRAKEIYATFGFPDFDINSQLTRVKAAVLIDQILHPFEKEVDIRGHYRN